VSRLLRKTKPSRPADGRRCRCLGSAFITACGTGTEGESSVLEIASEKVVPFWLTTIRPKVSSRA
jgi:hypothetical protein